MDESEEIQISPQFVFSPPKTRSSAKKKQQSIHFSFNFLFIYFIYKELKFKNFKTLGIQLEESIQTNPTYLFSAPKDTPKVRARTKKSQTQEVPAIGKFDHYIDFIMNSLIYVIVLKFIFNQNHMFVI
jgi:hypothetical protein